jgi:DNA polymerase-3 subunit epsilon
MPAPGANDGARRSTNRPIIGACPCLPAVSIPAFAPRLAFVDVETTGSSPTRERVTEIGVVRVDIDGASTRVDEWSTLVNPGMPIPPEIVWLTGITNDMVRAAPPFEAVAQDLLDHLDGAVFVAHNARFDYGFLRAEFARAGLAFHARTLCTVRLSRALYPDRTPHSLDALIERFGLGGEARHRALGDARVLWRLLQTWSARHPPGEIEAAVGAVLKHPGLPPHLPPDAIDALPHAPGVYLFYGLNEHPIYIGKSVDVRARVTSHFNSEHRAPRDLRLSQEIRRIEWEETAGEFGALLREAELVKTRLPAHNVALRRRENEVVMALDDHGRPLFSRALDFDLAALGAAWGPFASRPAARHCLAQLAAEHGLCLKTLGLEGKRARIDDGAPCFNRQLNRCHGACVGAEPRDAHAARLQEALAPWRLPAWPHRGAVASRSARCRPNSRGRWSASNSARSRARRARRPRAATARAASPPPQPPRSRARRSRAPTYRPRRRCGPTCARPPPPAGQRHRASRAPRYRPHPCLYRHR